MIAARQGAFVRVIRRCWIVVIACAMSGILAGAAEAHAPATVQDRTSPAERAYPPQQSLEAAMPISAEHDGCPSGSSHPSKQACASAGACHAIAIGAAAGVEPHAPSHAYGRRAERAPGGRNVRPPIHPPNR
jgi:hypothetical protein